MVDDQVKTDGKLPQRKGLSGTTHPLDKKHLDEKLDEALEETFPASDPIQLTSSDD